MRGHVSLMTLKPFLRKVCWACKLKASVQSLCEKAAQDIEGMNPELAKFGPRSRPI